MSSVLLAELEEIGLVLVAYLKKEITHKDISDWASNHYHRMFTNGDILYLEKLSYHNALRILRRLNDDKKWRQFDESDVEQLYNVIQGKEDLSYMFKMKIPMESEPTYNVIKNLKAMKIYELDITRMKKIFQNYSLINTISSEEITEIQDFLLRKPKDVKTILDVLVLAIIEELSYFYHIDEGFFKYHGKNKLLFTETREEDSITKLIKLMNCYIGIDSFSVLVVFREGKSSLSLVV